MNTSGPEHTRMFLFTMTENSGATDTLLLLSGMEREVFF